MVMRIDPFVLLMVYMLHKPQVITTSIVFNQLC